MPEFRTYFGRQKWPELRAGHIVKKVMQAKPGGGNATIGSSMNATYDPTFKDRAALAEKLATPLATVAITWLSSGGVFVGGNQFVFNMSAGRWHNATFNRVATASEANAAQNAAMTGAGAGSRGVWDLGPALRGFAIEQRLGGNLPTGFRIIDRFENGLATSIKSMDLASPTYQVAKNITSTGQGYIDLVAGFSGGSRAGTTIQANQITGRALDLVVPQSATAAQKTALDGLVQYGKSKGITVKIIVLPY